MSQFNRDILSVWHGTVAFSSGGLTRDSLMAYATSRGWGLFVRGRMLLRLQQPLASGRSERVQQATRDQEEGLTGPRARPLCMLARLAAVMPFG